VEEALGLAEEKADMEGEAKGVGVGDEGVMIGVDSEDEPLSEHEGDNGEESGPEEGSVGENSDDSNVNQKVRKLEKVAGLERRNLPPSNPRYTWTLT